ncbi:MAG TPA: ATP-grasp domain-containing protein [Candidatus Paceibacterota bacterium]|nr:ATP-grasp domain-containing protein [Candidatus Paceibacterota bacterium]
MKAERNIIVYVMTLPPGAIESIRAYEKREKRKFRVMLIKDVHHQREKGRDDYKGLDILVECDFSVPARIAEALAPYQNELCAITCRAESYMARFVQVIPHVPYLRTPTTESLRWATDKLEMRRRFKLLAKRYSPKYAIVRANTKEERRRVIGRIKFPMIVKPANLAQSLLVSVCYHEDELKEVLAQSFKKIEKIYAENGRIETPKMMVEEFMEGDMYSVDAYVNGLGRVYFCPMVRVFTRKNMGHDDFSNYIHMSPTGLKKKSVEAAHMAATAGIHALGLRNTTAHVELMKLDDEWKLIEIGPRVGGFRHKLHELSCDIDHSMNDILIRLPKRPILPKKCKGFAATLKWYPMKEGRITKLKGIKKCQELKSFAEISVLKKVGDLCKFAKNGGKAVFTLTLYNDERAKLLADIRRAEKLIDVQIV